MCIHVHAVIDEKYIFILICYVGSVEDFLDDIFR